MVQRVESCTREFDSHTSKTILQVIRFSKDILWGNPKNILSVFLRIFFCVLRIDKAVIRIDEAALRIDEAALRIDEAALRINEGPIRLFFTLKLFLLKPT